MYIMAYRYHILLIYITDKISYLLKFINKFAKLLNKNFLSLDINIYTNKKQNNMLIIN